MKRVCSILLIIFTHSLAFGQITFSEIMFDVATDENHDEFVEIFNLSLSDSIDLDGWQFSDSSGIDRILPHGKDTKIPPRSFAVILDGSYFNNSTTYDAIIPDSAIILTIDNNTFGSSGLSNTTGEFLTLTDANGNIVTGNRYTPGNKPGFSDEKMIINGEDDVENWQDSRVEGGTPGFHNSVSPWNVDLGWQDNSVKIPEILFEGVAVTIEVEINNLGTEDVEDTVTICCFIDKNENSLHDAADQTMLQKSFFYSAARTLWQIVCPNFPAGRQRIGFEIDYPEDQNRSNNLSFRDILVLTHQNVLHLNEIKFLTFSGEAEWIEIINAGTDPVSLKGWSIADARDTVEIDSLVYLYPGQLKVLISGALPAVYDVAESLVVALPDFLSLNNDEDDLALLEPGGRWMERLHYEADWLQDEDLRRQVSLERINPLLSENKQENWGPSVAVAGATPATANSIYAPLKRGQQQIMVSPNPFSPDGDGFQDAAIISGELAANSARIRVQIFDLKGRLIRTLQENRFSGRHFNLAWDGKDNSGRPARIGIYIIFMQMLDAQHGTLREMKTTVVLAHKL